MTAIYLDYNATSPIDPRVRDEVNRCFMEEFGNAGSPHEFGIRAKQIVNIARDRIARVVNARIHEVIFTSGATESNNLALLGMSAHGLVHGKRHIVTTQIEHKAVLEPIAVLKSRGFEISYIAPNSAGAVDCLQVLDAVRPDTLLVSVMHVNNETGMIQPIDKIADGLEKKKGVFLHVDAAQSFGKTSHALAHPRIDLIGISSHKINGPAGVGALVSRKRGAECVPLEPIMYGGGQELGLRPGTLPVAMISGFGLAAELARLEESTRRQVCEELRDVVLKELAPLNPVIHGDISNALAHVLCLSFPQWDADSVIEELAGVAAVSTGSACTSICATASHVLSSMKVRQPELDGAVRLSWGYQTDRTQLKQAMETIRNRLKV